MPIKSLQEWVLLPICSKGHMTSVDMWAFLQKYTTPQSALGSLARATLC